jgi:hypothetical protein
MSADEKRRFPRMPIFSAALITHQGNGWLSEVRDLSQGGACLARPHQWPSGQRPECRIYFIFDQETVIGLRVRVVRVGSDDLGLEFMPDQEERVAAVLYESRFIEQE